MKKNDCDFDVKAVQKYYDSGYSWRETIRHFGIPETRIWKSCQNGVLNSRTRSEAGKLSLKKNPRTHSEETKRKISKSRREYLQKHPDQVPYLLNHHSKGMSYPEKYFEKLFRNEKIDLLYHHQLGIYQLDFSDPVRKIDIEIDGEQHHSDKRIFISDRRRDKHLKDNGWVVYRVRWSTYKKLDYKSKELIVSQIKKVVSDRLVDCKIETTIKEYLDERKKKKLKYCADCKTQIKGNRKRCQKCQKKRVMERQRQNPRVRYPKEKKKCKNCENMINLSATLCVSCFHKSNRKAKNRPSMEVLKLMIDSMSWLAIGKKYGVSDNAVRKWARSYDII